MTFDPYEISFHGNDPTTYEKLCGVSSNGRGPRAPSKRPSVGR